MSVPPEYFDRVVGSVNFPLLQSRRVAVVGVGQVGSLLAAELAKCGVGYLLLIDHDILERQNLFRHVLPKDYLGWNKAEALAVYLAAEIENLETRALPRRVDRSVSDNLLDEWLSGTNLIVAATDDPAAQKRLGLRALLLGIPAIFPALYAEDGGEVVAQFNHHFPCFGCWSAFREDAEQLRGVTAVSFSALPVIFTSLGLCLAMLDSDSEYSELIANGLGEPPSQVFRLNRFGRLRRLPLERRSDCPACGGGAGPGTAEPIVTGRPGLSEVPPPSSDDEQLWENRSTGIRTISSRTPADQPNLQPQLWHSPVVDVPATPEHPGARRRQHTVNRVLLAACAVIAATLLIVMFSTDSRPPAEISAPVSVSMDYNRSLFTLIAAAHLHTIEYEVPITETQFPVGLSGPARVKVVLIRLTTFKPSEATDVVDPAHDQATYDEVLDDLSQLGYRPATLPELLALIAQDPEVQSPSIVELAGPVYHGEDVACVASQGYLQCSSVAHGFDPAAEFVAVPT